MCEFMRVWVCQNGYNFLLYNVSHNMCFISNSFNQMKMVQKTRNPTFRLTISQKKK